MDSCEYSVFHLNVYGFLYPSQKFLTEETVLTEVKRGNPAESEGKLPVKDNGKEIKGPLFVSKPPMIHFKVQL